MTGGLPLWQPMQAGHVSAVAALADRLHPDFPERPAVFAERLRLCRAGCHVLGTPPSGYLISHPWHRHSPPPLDTLLGALPVRPDCWYLHDLALSPALRGTGLAAAGVALAAAACRAAGLAELALVAVNGSAGFWRRQGFRPAAAPVPGGYGDAAAFMTRPA